MKPCLCCHFVPHRFPLGDLWSHPGAGDAIFDAHIHYSQSDWDSLSPEQAIAILEQAGIRKALVPSTPDEGTLNLYQADPKRIVSFLWPYRTGGDDPAVQPYLEERLGRGIYKGIGEFHLTAVNTDFLCHPDRFMVRTDTWIPSRWHSLAAEAKAARVWLGQLPREVAEQIAYLSGERLFGSPQKE